uniref:Uncharacterized protein n=1 Tax=Pseudomonas phage KV2023 TaxID=3234047 RepID=A0AB39C6Y2_9CAUD
MASTMQWDGMALSRLYRQQQKLSKLQAWTSALWILSTSTLLAGRLSWKSTPRRAWMQKAAPWRPTSRASIKSSRRLSNGCSCFRLWYSPVWFVQPLPSGRGRVCRQCCILRAGSDVLRWRLPHPLLRLPC